MSARTTDAAWRFDHAVVRRPGPAVVDGLRAEDRGTPDLEAMLRDHAHYVDALRSTGATVLELPPLADFPDAVFVEDVALCLPGLAVLMRPGAPSRAGEVAHVAPTLHGLFDVVRSIEGPGHIEGGDVLFTGRELLVGLSSRTDEAGVDELRDVLARHAASGADVPALRRIETPPGVLHFKTDCSLLGEGTVLSTERLSRSGCFEGYRVIRTGDGEEAAANCIRFNELVLMPAGFPATAGRVRAAGFEVREIGNAECAKIDGGMSCLSLRFTADRG